MKEMIEKEEEKEEKPPLDEEDIDRSEFSLSLSLSFF